jgi:hypothetical protein
LLIGKLLDLSSTGGSGALIKLACAAGISAYTWVESSEEGLEVNILSKLW